MQESCDPRQYLYKFLAHARDIFPISMNLNKIGKINFWENQLLGSLTVGSWSDDNEESDDNNGEESVSCF